MCKSACLSFYSFNASMSNVSTMGSKMRGGKSTKP